MSNRNARGKIQRRIYYNVENSNLVNLFNWYFLVVNKPREIDFVKSKLRRQLSSDEAHVYEAHIDFYSANKYLLIDLMRLIQLKFPEIKISSLKINNNSKNPKYYFYVMGESKEYFLNLIGFGHEQKHKELVFNIERSLLNKRGGETWYDKKNNP